MQEDDYRREFTDALRDFVDMNQFKYAIFTDMIYEELLTELMTAILDNTYDNDEALKLKLFNAISVEEQFCEWFWSRH